MTNEGTPFKTATGLLRRTTPFLVLNAAVYGGFFLAIIVWLAIFGGLAALFANRIEVLAIVFVIIAIAGPFALMALARRYLLYLVQGAHIAVATTLLFEGQLPEGQSQVAYGRAQVQQRFRDVSILFAVDRAVHGVVSTFTRRFVNIAERLPLGDGVGQLARIAASIVNRSVSYVDEAILSYAILRNESNVWRSARHGVILYAQAYKPILGAAVKIWLLGRAVFIGLLIILGIPAVLVLLTFDAVWFQIVVLVAVVMLAWLITAATYEPFAVIYNLVTYHRAIDGVEVDAVWDRRLQQVSNKFKEIVDKARQGGDGADPLDAASVPPATTQPDHPDRPAPPDSSGSPGGDAAGGTTPLGNDPLAALRSVGRGGGLSGLVGGLLSQVGQPSQSTPQQPPAAQPNPPLPPPPAAPPAPTRDEGEQRDHTPPPSPPSPLPPPAPTRDEGEQRDHTPPPSPLPPPPPSPLPPPPPSDGT